jgi:cytosine/adenosine deaminase-related metal-dependent hydrolase
VTRRIIPENGQAIAYKARWLWCPEQGLMQDKCLVCEAGQIRGISAKPPKDAISRDLGQGVLMPGLVNAHTHLELSFLAGQVPPRGDFVAWIRQLVLDRKGPDPQTAANMALAAAQASAQGGVCLAGDISNTGRAQEAWQRAGISALTFWEGLGSKQIGPEAESLNWQDGLLIADAMAAHAPYSVPAPRIKLLKSRADQLPFCMHLAESVAEMEFFTGTGEQGERLAEFLTMRGVDLAQLELCGQTPLEHLMNLGVIDANTLLVHGVQLKGDEIARLAETGASFCICPRSNLGLTAKMAKVPEMLKAGVNLALGTDSLASAPDLSLWAEMKTLLKHYPQLKPGTVLEMATIGGAKALGQEESFGSLLPGKKAALCFRAAKASSNSDPLESAVYSG